MKKWATILGVALLVSFFAIQSESQTFNAEIEIGIGPMVSGNVTTN